MPEVGLPARKEQVILWVWLVKWWSRGREGDTVWLGCGGSGEVGEREDTAREREGEDEEGEAEGREEREEGELELHGFFCFFLFGLMWEWMWVWLCLW